jgi:hypothetical protein
MSDFDLAIAVHALAYGLTLASADRAFERLRITRENLEPAAAASRRMLARRPGHRNQGRSTRAACGDPPSRLAT